MIYYDMHNRRLKLKKGQVKKKKKIKKKGNLLYFKGGGC